jgi:hypothetical protein
MSEILVNTIKKADGTGNLSVPAETGTVVTTASPSLGRRNLIINGAMQVAQRGTSATGVNTNGYRTVDRWTTNMNSGGGTWTVTQESSGGVSGFPYSTKIECTTATGTLSGTEKARWEYRPEGQDLKLLKWGTSDAETITISFWVKSNKTGTYTWEINNYDGTTTNHICKQYTIDAADTWEYKTLTVVGDTGVSTRNTNGTGSNMYFHLVAGPDLQSGTLATSWAVSTNANRAAGNVNLGDTVGNYWQITGVQLEVGSVATPFEHRSYGEELAACQRYYTTLGQGILSSLPVIFGMTFGNRTADVMYQADFPVTMRDTPNITIGSSGSGAGTASTSYVTERGISLFYTSCGSSNVWLANVTAEKEL